MSKKKRVLIFTAIFPRGNFFEPAPLERLMDPALLVRFEAALHSPDPSSATRTILDSLEASGVKYFEIVEALEEWEEHLGIHGTDDQEELVHALLREVKPGGSLFRVFFHGSIFPGVFQDSQGVEECTITNDGVRLGTILRGVEFRGVDFDQLGVVDLRPEGDLGAFTLNRGDLCGCTLHCRIPVSITEEGRETANFLEMTLKLGNPAPNGGIDEETVQLVLHVGDSKYASRETEEDFESALIHILEQLPPGFSIKCCFTCAFSDYSVYGQGLFGTIFCFRDIPTEYLKVQTKIEYMEIMDQFTEIVQETHLCPKFQRRNPGTGYRG